MYLCIFIASSSVADKQCNKARLLQRQEDGWFGKRMANFGKY
jgi:hypothetical protein